jgi:hypothetical protein
VRIIGRGGYQFLADPSSYMVCAKTVCATVAVPTGIVESSAVIGPCKFGD